MHTTHTTPMRLSEPVHSGQAPDFSTTSSVAGARALPVVDSEDLLRGQKTVDINHNGAVYRLQATRLGKLILTK